MRQFGKACLELENLPADDDALVRMSNKLAQIAKGRKGIPLHDLPVFTHLLGVSCEQLLSAGTCCVPAANYMTNRQFAASHDENDWESYINREDAPFLNIDEFGKNVIEYALEFKNYDLLKYLMEKQYIWFIGPDREKYFTDFAAGTKIKRRTPIDIDKLVSDLRDPDKCGDRLRRQMICLALENKDFSMLDRLKAREIPPMYQRCASLIYPYDLSVFRDEEMISRIVKADDDVIDYFTQEFLIPERISGDRDGTYLFPYIKDVAERLLAQAHPCCEAVLLRCAEHNRKFLQQLESCIQKITEEKIRYYEDEWNSDPLPSPQELRHQSIRSLKFREDDIFLSFYDAKGRTGAVTNLVTIDSTCDSLRLRPLIDDINKSYQTILQIKQQAN